MSTNEGPRGSNQVTRALTRTVEVPAWVVLLLLLAAIVGMVDFIARRGWVGVALLVVSGAIGLLLARRDSKRGSAHA